MINLTVRPLGENIELRIQSDGGVASVTLDPRGGFALIASIARAINALSLTAIAPGRVDQAVLKTKEPWFEVAATAAGGAILAIGPDVFPSLEFEFGAVSLAELVDELKAYLRE